MPQDDEPGTPRSGNLTTALFALGSAAGQGLFLLALDHAADGDPYSATFVMRLFSCALTLVVFCAAAVRALKRPSRVASGLGTGMADDVAITCSGPMVTPVPARSLSLVLPRAAGSVPVAGTPRRQSLGWLLPTAAGLADATAEACFAVAGASGELSVVAVLSSL